VKYKAQKRLFSAFFFYGHMKIIVALLLNLATLVCLAAAPDTVRLSEVLSKNFGRQMTPSSMAVDNPDALYLSDQRHGSMTLKNNTGIVRRRVGRALTFGGPLVIWAGFSLLEEARRQNADFDPATPLGVIGVAVGILATGTGIALWYSGSKAGKKYQQQKSSLTFTGRGVALTF
jgi:hypothetical protein